MLSTSTTTSPPWAASTRRPAASRVEPWYHFSVLTDQMRSMAPDPMSRAARLGGGGGGFDLAAMLARAGDDLDLLRSVLRVLNLLDPPESLLAQLPALQAAVAAVPEDPTTLPSRPRRPRPTRDELLAVVA